MAAPVNTLKEKLAAGQLQTGCWLTLAQPYASEIAGTAGFDWVLIDGEHAPNGIGQISSQIGALQGSKSAIAVRVPVGEDWIIKQVLDAGAQTVMVPMVETGAQARAMVRATRYAPDGVRGVGASVGRASHWTGIADYSTTANAQMCLIVQVEAQRGLENLDDILAVEGVDAVFIGPADLAADMGYLGELDAPEVMAAMEDAVLRIRAAGKAAGIMCTDPDFAQQAISWGVNFAAVAVDAITLTTGLRRAASAFKD
ncbi:HpcH/HpaI aldolase family protein [Neptunicoccus cionae]|uniref:Hydroxypyruvate/pyruvate aldolase n=1 Tax=Neptunicoccus cionae TaxID=2035344 RepID=A0A916QU26_9RHOB|nr:HpcH/HpaI aldolase/citrate lyase family protein [Amylibacter cionae]GGA07646.1 2,4-dihydroxyhept-2-ene-1,7-dioic acid aldolase [Amylibacter cionae]